MLFLLAAGYVIDAILLFHLRYGSFSPVLPNIHPYRLLGIFRGRL